MSAPSQSTLGDAQSFDRLKERLEQLEASRNTGGNRLDHVQVTLAEKVDAGHRGSFYDATSALRDTVPNRLFSAVM